MFQQYFESFYEISVLYSRGDPRAIIQALRDGIEINSPDDVSS